MKRLLEHDRRQKMIGRANRYPQSASNDRCKLKLLIQIKVQLYLTWAIENMLHLPRRSTGKSMHGGQRIIFLCAKPRVDDGDPTANCFSGSEIAFRAEKKHRLVASRLIVR